jgi:3-hydroxybutyryl-CoA dehydrogenase
MAPQIAAACLLAGTQVVVAARNPAKAVAAAQQATAWAGVGSSARGLELAPAAFKTAELVVEAIVEGLVAKEHLLALIEPWVRDEAVISTNTSSLQIGRLAQSLDHPERFAGFHFLNPAHLTAVVEVVAGEQTDADVVDALAALSERMGKRPLRVNKDVPGFIWNRVQFAVLRECVHLIEEGVAGIEAIDAAVADGLAPRWIGAGPLATADIGGLATFIKIAEGLFPVLSQANDVPSSIYERVQSGSGFYAWSVTSQQAVTELRDRLLSGRARRDRASPSGDAAGRRPATLRRTSPLIRTDAGRQECNR